MTLRGVLAALFVIVMGTVCVRLGFWQIARLHEKQALNRAQQAALASPPVPVSDPATPAAALRGRRVRVRGAFDERRQLLLAGRVVDGAPGVGVVTPLVLADGHSAVLVERGWLPADDAATAHPERYPEPGQRDVLGLVEPFPPHAGHAPYVRLPSDSASLWSARFADLDSMTTRVPYHLAGFLVRQLPAAGVPELPRRGTPKPFDESMHLNYAIQWFSFATILAGGSLALALRRRRSGTADTDLRVPPMPR